MARSLSLPDVSLDGGHALSAPVAMMDMYKWVEDDFGLVDDEIRHSE